MKGNENMSQVKKLLKHIQQSHKKGNMSSVIDAMEIYLSSEPDYDDIMKIVNLLFEIQNDERISNENMLITLALMINIDFHKTPHYHVIANKLSVLANDIEDDNFISDEGKYYVVSALCSYSEVMRHETIRLNVVNFVNALRNSDNDTVDFTKGSIMWNYITEEFNLIDSFHDSDDEDDEDIHPDDKEEMDEVDQHLLMKNLYLRVIILKMIWMSMTGELKPILVQNEQTDDFMTLLGYVSENTNVENEARDIVLGDKDINRIETIEYNGHIIGVNMKLDTLSLFIKGK